VTDSDTTESSTESPVSPSPTEASVEEDSTASPTVFDYDFSGLYTTSNSLSYTCPSLPSNPTWACAQSDYTTGGDDATAELSCSSGVISCITFASVGKIAGSCAGDAFTEGDAFAYLPESVGLGCIGQSSCDIVQSDGTLGGVSFDAGDAGSMLKFKIIAVCDTEDSDVNAELEGSGEKSATRADRGSASISAPKHDVLAGITVQSKTKTGEEEDLESELTAQESQSKDKKKDSKKKGSSKKDTKSSGGHMKGTRAPANKKSRGEEEDLESELTAQKSQSKDKKKDSKKKGSKKKGSSKKDTKSWGWDKKWDMKGTRAPTIKKKPNRLSIGEEEEIQQDDVLSALLTERNFVADSQK